MTVRKRDPRLVRRHLIVTTIFAVPFLLCFASVWRYGWSWLTFTIASVIAMVGLVLQELRFRRYRCPDCGSVLPYIAGARGARIEYVCARCDVIWNSGFIDSSD